MSLQMGLLDSEGFAEACTLWSGSSDEVSLADLLVERKMLSPTDREDVDRFVDRKLAQHGGDVEASLAATLVPGVQGALASVEDEEVRDSLGGLPGQPGQAGASAEDHGHHMVMATVGYDPQRRERYTLTRLYGKGGVGQVWVARDEDLGREVALKELKEEGLGSQGVQDRFIREAQITGQLEHPGIVPVYELSTKQETGQPYYTMKLVRGRTLREAIKSYHDQRSGGGGESSLDLTRLLNLFVSVCRAVDYAHSRDVIHRDLKSENVVLGDYGEAVVLDWGLAKVLTETESGEQDLALSDQLVPGGEGLGERPLEVDRGSAAGQTMSGQVLGTPGYMSPEQAEGRHDLVGLASDVYGLGSILYEILSGEPPFTGTKTLELLKRVVHEEAIPLRQRDSRIARSLEAVVLKSLSKRPGDRYASAGALAADVECYLADEPVSVLSDPLLSRLDRWSRRHRGLVVTAGVSLLLVTGLSVVAAVLIEGQRQQVAESRKVAVENAERAQRLEGLAEENLDAALSTIDRYMGNETRGQLSSLPGLQNLQGELDQTAEAFYLDLADFDQGDAARRPGLIQSLGMVRGSSASSDKERVESVRRELAVLDQAIEAEPKTAHYRLRSAWSRLSLSKMLSAAGEPQEARKELDRSLGDLEQLSEAHGELARHRMVVYFAEVYHEYFNQLRIAADPEAASTWSSKSIEMCKQHLERFPNNGNAMYSLGRSYADQATLHLSRGDQSQAAAVMEDVVKQMRAWTNLPTLGMEFLEAIRFDVAGELGVRIDVVSPDSQAAAAGLRGRRARPFGESQPGDKIVAIDGKAIGSLPEFLSLIGSAEKGKPVRLTIQRDGKEQEIEATPDSSVGLLRRLRTVVLASTLFDAAVGHEGARQGSAAVQKLNEAARILRPIVEENPDVPKYRRILANVYQHLVKHQLRNRTTAQESARLMQEHRRVIYKTRPTTADGLSTLGGDLHNDAGALSAIGLIDEAYELILEATRAQAEAMELDPQSVKVRLFMANHHSLRGRYEASRGELSVGLSSLVKAETIYQGLVDEQPKQVRFRAALARTLSREFEFNMELGRSSVALAVTDRMADQEKLLRKLQPGSIRLQRVAHDAQLGRLLAIANSIDYNTAVVAAKGELLGGQVVAGPRRLELAMVLALASGSAEQDSALSTGQPVSARRSRPGWPLRVSSCWRAFAERSAIRKFESCSTRGDWLRCGVTSHSGHSGSAWNPTRPDRLLGDTR